jgi:cytoskeletal protein RodZ
MLTLLKSVVVGLILISFFLIQLVVISPVHAQEIEPSADGVNPTEEVYSEGNQLNQEQNQPSDQEQATPSDRSPAERSTASDSKSLTYPEPPNPYNREAIEQFDQELYGTGR